MPASTRQSVRFPSFVRKVTGWFGQRSGHDLDNLSAAERAMIARDLNMSTDELADLATRSPESAALLTERMAALHLDQKALRTSSPAVVQDLERRCSACDSKGDCRQDLSLSPDDPAWKSYCPNVQTLEALAGQSRPA